MPTFAAVDIGSNSVRLKIARLHRRRLQVVHEDREVTRLGESVFRAGTLDPATMAHTIQVLHRFHRAVQSRGVEQVRVVATSALRDARNAAAFSDWVRSATGWQLEIISGLEEGRLIHLALASDPHIGKRPALLFDLGGGSCEITASNGGHIEQMFSLPLGAVRLTQEFLRHDPPRPKEITRLGEFISHELRRIEKRLKMATIRVTVATSGTAAALAAAWGAKHHSRSPVVPRAGVARLAKILSRRSVEERKKLPGIGPRRAEIIVAGAAVFAELLTRFRLPSFRYSPLGLRDGVLAQMAAEYDRATRFGRQIESERQAALLELGHHYGVDLIHAGHVRELVLELFNALKRMHRLPPEYAEWLAAAAMVHDVGSFINRAGRRRHSYYIISNSEIFGYSAEQRRIIATIARYQGKSRPDAANRILRLLTPKDRPLIPKAVTLLRLARALDQGRNRAVKDIRVQVRRGTVALDIRPSGAAADLEIWAVEKERAYFREVFGRELAPALS